MHSNTQERRILMDYRDQRRAYRRYGNINAFIWPAAIILFIVTHTWIWFLVAIFAPMLIAGLLSTSDQSSQQQQQYYQPVYQPPSEQPVYQPPVEPPVYQPYQQGYAPQPSVRPHPETYQASEQPQQYQEQQQQQYEDPLIMYPQE